MISLIKHYNWKALYSLDCSLAMAMNAHRTAALLNALNIRRCYCVTHAVHVRCKCSHETTEFDVPNLPQRKSHTRPSCALWNSFSIRKKFPIKVTHYVAHSEAHQPGALDCSPNIARWCASLENRSEIVSNALNNPESEWPSCVALSVAVFYQLLPLEPFLLPNSSRILVTFGQTCRCLFKAVRGWTNFRDSRLMNFFIGAFQSAICQACNDLQVDRKDFSGVPSRYPSKKSAWKNLKSFI